MNEFSELGVPTSVQGAENTVINRVRNTIKLPF